jgi:hypothetical protein
VYFRANWNSSWWKFIVAPASKALWVEGFPGFGISGFWDADGPV